VDDRSPDTQAMAAAVPPQQAALAYRAALAHLGELDSAPLTIPGDDAVEIVTVAEVRDWLGGLVARARAGERL
jgi:hypothetical protein